MFIELQMPRDAFLLGALSPLLIYGLYPFHTKNLFQVLIIEISIIIFYLHK